MNRQAAAKWFARRALLWAALALSAVFLLIGTKSSPLYPLNDNVDLNVFMTMGRGILAGKVPYRDLFEQKGPALFFLHAPVSLIFPRGYFGQFLLEVICFALFLFYSAKLVGLYVKNRAAQYLVMLFLSAALPLAPSFNNSGTVEQIFLFALPLTAYLLLKGVKEKKPLTLAQNLLIGLLAAFGFWSKYTFSGFFAAAALFVIIWYLSEKWFMELFLAALKMLGGFLLLTVPILLYFSANQALADLINVYFTQNMEGYARSEKSAWEYITGGVRGTLRSNRAAYGWLMWPGAALLLFAFIKRRWREALLPILCFFGLAATTYMSSPGYSYYGLIFAPFCILGLIALTLAPERLLLRFGKGQTTRALSPPVKLLLAGGCFCAIAGCLFALYSFTPNRYLLGVKKQDTPQYRFAAQMAAVPNATMLNYWFLDGGFYHAAGIQPINRYYCYFNINPPELAQEQVGMIKQGAFDFVVCRKHALSQQMIDEGGYELIDEMKMNFAGFVYDYYLFQKK